MEVIFPDTLPVSLLTTRKADGYSDKPTINFVTAKDCASSLPRNKSFHSDYPINLSRKKQREQQKSRDPGILENTNNTRSRLQIADLPDKVDKTRNFNSSGSSSNNNDDDDDGDDEQ
ncbi:hypothetical protein DINM_003744 [Dirofilaria immitis]|nr:hypothetical protein [Dirofilaria immitis]